MDLLPVGNYCECRKTTEGKAPSIITLVVFYFLVKSYEGVTRIKVLLLY